MFRFVSKRSSGLSFTKWRSALPSDNNEPSLSGSSCCLCSSWSMIDYISCVLILRSSQDFSRNLLALSDIFSSIVDSKDFRSTISSSVNSAGLILFGSIIACMLNLINYFMNSLITSMRYNSSWLTTLLASMSCFNCYWSPSVPPLERSFWYYSWVSEISFGRSTKVSLLDSGSFAPSFVFLNKSPGLPSLVFNYSRLRLSLSTWVDTFWSNSLVDLRSRSLPFEL